MSSALAAARRRSEGTSQPVDFRDPPCPLCVCVCGAQPPPDPCRARLGKLSGQHIQGCIFQLSGIKTRSAAAPSLLLFLCALSGEAGRGHCGRMRMLCLVPVDSGLSRGCQNLAGPKAHKLPSRCEVQGAGLAESPACQPHQSHQEGSLWV